jgi:hypothetical protein
MVASEYASNVVELWISSEVRMQDAADELCYTGGEGRLEHL